MPLKKHIIHIDDSEIDALIYNNYFKRIDSDIDYVWLKNSHALLNYLDRIYSKHNACDITNSVIILLDINMPGEDGFEVLEILNSYQNSAQILPPIIMLSSSNCDNDKEKSRALGAADYYVKHVDPYHIKYNLEQLIDKWIYC